MSPTGAYYLDTYSNLSTPGRTTLHSGDGKELGVYREADRTQADQYDIRPTEIVRFKGADGSEFYGRLIKPAGFEPGKKYPVIVPMCTAVPEWARRCAMRGPESIWIRFTRTRDTWSGSARTAASWAAATDFETAIYHKLGVTELADQVAGVKHLISLGFADPARIGITGTSYGGFMTINAMLNAPDVFQAGVAGAPVTNWINYDTIYTERYMGLPKDNPDGYKDTALTREGGESEGQAAHLPQFRR